MGHRTPLGGGSVFWLELPAGVVDPADPVVSPAVPDRRLDVLIADDSAINREVATAFLRQAGHTVSEARDGAQAVHLAATHDFDVVLMDMRMEELDGLEAARRIRSLPGSRGDVPIVAVTANALDQHIQECRHAGMSQHLAKPYTQPELLAVVARVAKSRPAASADPVPAIDPACMEQLTDCMGPDAVRRLLDVLALRIEALLRRLDEPVPQVPPGEMAALAHELIGSGGTLGFTRLAATAARFESELAFGHGDVAAMRAEATAALSELRRGRSLEAILAL
jgi:CheY-like chemotaxis protein/HPt (histidine-containing phosphotransfer) domain-containing protein